MSCQSLNPVVGKVKNDFDGDGIVDKIVLDGSKHDQDGMLESKRVVIIISSTAKTIQAVVKTHTGNLSVYQGENPNELVVDFTNRSSRDAAELSYLVYEWDKRRQDFCLKASVDGVPANQLRNELTPKQVEMARYSECARLDSSLQERPSAKAKVPHWRLASDRSLRKQTQRQMACVMRANNRFLYAQQAPKLPLSAPRRA